MLNTRKMFLSVGLALALALGSAPALAASRAQGAQAAACASPRAAHALGVDGGLSALRSGDLVLTPAAVVAPRGVDGGLLSLLFARAEQAGYPAVAVTQCVAPAAGISPGG